MAQKEAESLGHLATMLRRALGSAHIKHDEL